LYVEVFIEGMAFDEGSMRLGQLFTVELDEDSLDIINELVDP
jgi:hypothetical protein